MLETRELFERARLVTICGAPGIGKTRMATQYLATQGGHARTAWCELSECRSGEDVVVAVAAAIDVEQEPGTRYQEFAEKVAQALSRTGPILIVMDNMEQLLECAALTIGTWLDRAPAVFFLATSREPLGLSGETLLRIGPLPQDVATELFLDRASAVRDALPEDRGAIEEVVNSLDCIPLGIELAAAQSSFLSPAKMLERLRTCLSLRNKLREAPARQHSVFASIDWSWQLMQPWEQEALAQVGSFVGGFNLEAAEAVIDVGHHPEAPTPIEVLSALCDKSLIRVDDSDEQIRYRLFLSIREFAWNNLKDSEFFEPTLLRHAHHHIEAAKLDANATPDASRKAQLRYLICERDNLVAAHERHLSRDPRVAAEAALALAPLLRKQGVLELGWKLLADAIRAADNAGATTLAIDVRLERAQHYCLSVDVESAMSDLSWAKREALALGDQYRLCLAARYMTFALTNSDQLDAALVSVAEAISLADTHGFPEELAHAYRQRAHLYYQEGDFDAAELDFRRAAELHRKLGDTASEALDSNGIIGRLIDCGRVDAAIEYAEKCIEVQREHGHQNNEAILLVTMGAGLSLQRRYDEAKVALERGRTLHRRCADFRSEVIALVNIGFLAIDEGQGERAVETMLVAVEISTQKQFTWIKGLSLSVLGASFALVGRADDAREALAQARDILQTQGNQDWNLVCDAHHLYLDVLMVRNALAQNEFDTARERLSEIEPLLAVIRPHSEECQDIVMAVRGLDALLTECRKPLTAKTLAVGPGTSWFAIRDQRVGLSRRRPLRLVLAALVQARLRSPGKAVSVDQLIEEGWPDQQVQRKSAQNRLWVTINELRKLGLKDVLAKRDEGYWLTEDYDIVIEPVVIEPVVVDSAARMRVPRHESDTGHLC